MSFHTKRSVCMSVLALSIVSAMGNLGAHHALAVPVLVPNGGFETDILGEGSLDSTPSDWVVVAGSLNQQGSWNPTSPHFTGGIVPSTGEGNNVALINLARSGVAGSDFSSFTSAASLGTVEDKGIYTLTVAVGSRATSFVGDQYTIEFLLDDVVFGPSTVLFDASTVPADSFVDVMTSFTATPSEAGAELKVRVTQSTFAGTGTAAGHFDNVRLDFIQHVPEPSSFMLLGFGALGLMRHARRRRRRA